MVQPHKLTFVTFLQFYRKSFAIRFLLIGLLMACCHGNNNFQVSLAFTGRIPQKISTELWQQKQAQHCNSSGSDNVDITMCTLA